MNKLKLVRFDFSDLPKKYHSEYPFSKHQTFVMLGEIDQMDGHCVVADIKTGQIYSCYHTENFVELSEDEV
jgi:hypothetical protein